MEFSDFQEFTTLGLEGAACLLLVVIGYKIYKMKIHSKSGCCGNRFVVETMNKGGSSRDLEFTDLEQGNKQEQPTSSVI